MLEEPDMHGALQKRASGNLRGTLADKSHVQCTTSEQLNKPVRKQKGLRSSWNCVCD